MRANTTDKEQIETLKKWWNDYGKAIVVAVIIGLLIGFGWRYWRSHHLQKAENASAIYQSMVFSDSEKNYKLAQAYGKQLITQYADTPYASTAALLWAKEAVVANNMTMALNRLQWVIKRSDVKAFKQIARVRAARILLAENKLDAALAMVNKIEDKAYLPTIQQVKGDIFRAQGNNKQALQALTAAKNGLAAIGVVDPILDLKLATA